MVKALRWFFLPRLQICLNDDGKKELRKAPELCRNLYFLKDTLPKNFFKKKVTIAIALILETKIMVLQDFFLGNQ